MRKTSLALIYVLAVTACTPVLRHETPAPTAIATEAAGRSPLPDRVAVSTGDPVGDGFDRQWRVQLSELAEIAVDQDAFTYSAPPNLFAIDLTTGLRRLAYSVPGSGVSIAAFRGGLVVHEETAPQPDGRIRVRLVETEWRSGMSRVVDELWWPGESLGPLREARTNGRVTVWHRTRERADGTSVAEFVRRNADMTREVLARFDDAVYWDSDDAGRLAVVRLPAGWTGDAELSLTSDGVTQALGQKKGTESGQIYFGTDHLVWANGLPGPDGIHSADVITLSDRSRKTVAFHGCRFEGATVRHAVFGCGARLRVLDVPSGRHFDIEAPHGAFADRYGLVRRIDGALLIDPVR